MKLSVAACELPHPEGTAAGRDLWSWCEGMRALGHQVEAWVWFRSPSSPVGPVPEWCQVQPFDAGAKWARHLRAVRRPRQEISRAGWAPDPDPDTIAVADHLWSAAAVTPFPRSVATLHFRALADARAQQRRPTAADIQMARAERLAARQAELVLAYSQRVASGLGRRAPMVRVVPIACPVPPEPVPLVDRPVAALVADWSWPPNRLALGWLLDAWPEVRQQVPGARLVLAGRHLADAGLGCVAGVEARGPVARSTDVLAEASVIPFPCPATSGPKMKVLEALAHGLAVVTTAAGVEGVAESPSLSPRPSPSPSLSPGGGSAPGAVVTDRRQFSETLAALLADPERRAALGTAGRAAVLACHSPEASARARAVVFARAFGTDLAADTQTGSPDRPGEGGRRAGGQRVVPRQQQPPETRSAP